LTRVLAVPDVLRDQLLERLQLLKERFRRHALLRLVAEQPGRRVDGGPPRDLLGVSISALRAGFVVLERLDLVEVDVCVTVSLLLVAFDPGPAALGGEGLSRDRFAERRVLVPRL